MMKTGETKWYEGIEIEIVEPRRDDDGRKRLGSIRILGHIAQTSMGWVKEAQDTATGELLAVRVMHTSFLRRKKEFISGPGGRMQVITNLDKVARELRLLQQKIRSHPRCVALRKVFVVQSITPKGESKIYAVLDRVAFGGVMKPGLRKPSSRTAEDHEEEVDDSDCAYRPLAVVRNGFGEIRPVDVGEVTGYPESLAKCFAHDAARALEYLHSTEVNVAHRDVKPDNFFLDADGRLKLGDFGVSEVMDEHGRVRRTEGTYHFLPPECTAPVDSEFPYTGHDGRKADVWALGVCIWAFVSGSLPFNGRSLQELFDNITKAEYDVNECHCHSDELVDLMKEMLRRNVAERISATEALLHPWVASADFTVAAEFAAKLRAVDAGIIGDPRE